MVHPASGPADGDAILTNRKVILVPDLDSPFFIEVNEGGDLFLPAVEVVGHGIMCRIQEPFFVPEIRKESLHPEISFQEAMGIVFGSGVQKREDGEVAFRIGCNDHVQVIPVVEAVPGGIPADITVRLREILVTAAPSDAFGGAVTDAVSPFPGRGDNRRAIPGDGEGRRIDKPSGDRFLQEFPVVYFEKGSIRLLIDGKRGRFQPLKQLFDSDFFDGFCFGAFLFWLFNLFLFDRMYMRGKIVGIRIPEPVNEIIKSTNTGSVPKFESTQDGVERVDLQLCSPVRQGSHLKINGQQIGTLHTGGSSWFRAKDRILWTQEFIRIGQVEIPKAFDDIPGGTREGVWRRIIFTEICSNKILVGGMAAGINR